MANNPSAVSKKIHHIWFDFKKKSGGEKPPQKYDKYKRKIRELHKDWEIIAWNENGANNLIRTHYPWFWKTWESYKAPIHRVDVIRLFILHKHGGFYLDQDIEIENSLEHLLSNFPLATTFLIESGHNPGNVSNYIMGSTIIENPFFETCINGLQKQLKKLAFFHRVSPSYIGVFLISGSLYLNSIAKQKMKISEKLNSYTFENSEGQIIILPAACFYGTKNPSLPFIKYGTHLYSFSWNLGPNVLIDVWMSLLVIFVVGIVIGVIVVLVLLRRNKI